MPIRLPSILAITAAMVAALTLSACGTSPMAEPPPPSATTVQPARLEAALVAHTWKLVSARDNDGRYMSALFPANSKPVTFNFAEGRISIQGGCNVRGGAFQINSAYQLAVGQTVSTMMACEPTLMAVDKAITAALAKPLDLRIEMTTPPSMTLLTAANETLVFTGERTLESQHGKPTRMFLEVAPQKVACNHPLMPNAQCLQTREVTFNEQGLRVGEPGPWQVFQGDIQGFNFEPGYRSVLRV
ncbi:MAG: META and DUF4377 domain-containing protein, partial [Burkholderiaceae bacterium]|nr:META and DUF4377 domain-containing protein [Burkholderiaceae bacterium]